jgi:predicted permease
MDQVINTLLPVFLVIGLGFLLAKRDFLSEAVLHELNRLIFWICLPALIVGKLATAQEMPSGTGSIFLVFALATLGTIGCGLLVARMLGLGANQVGTFVQAAFRGNLAYTGIPLILFALQREAPHVVSSVTAQVLFVFAPTMLLYNVTAVILLVQDREVPLRDNFLAMIKKVAKNPLILASLLGVSLFLLPLSLPKFLISALDLTGQMASPAALFCVGGSMAYVSMQGRYRSACFASLLKVVVTPALAWAIALGFDLDAHSRLVLLILSACPTAVASYVMAKELNGDEALASGAIVISTMASLPILALVVGVL